MLQGTMSIDTKMLIEYGHLIKQADYDIIVGLITKYFEEGGVVRT